MCLCARIKRKNFNLSFHGPHHEYTRRILSEKGSKTKSRQTPEAQSSSYNTHTHTYKFLLENPTVGEIAIELFKLNQCLL